MRRFFKWRAMFCKASSLFSAQCTKLNTLYGNVFTHVLRKKRIIPRKYDRTRGMRDLRHALGTLYAIKESTRETNAVAHKRAIIRNGKEG